MEEPSFTTYADFAVHSGPTDPSPGFEPIDRTRSEAEQAAYASLVDYPPFVAHPNRNPAVLRCIEAGLKAFVYGHSRNYPFKRCARFAQIGYFEQLPSLTSRQNICDFIDCVTYAMVCGLLPEENTSKMLYAAQVALTAARDLPRSKKKGASAPKHKKNNVIVPSPAPSSNEP